VRVLHDKHNLGDRERGEIFEFPKKCVLSLDTSLDFGAQREQNASLHSMQVFFSHNAPS
jgi:hypothetical protein